MKRPISLVLAFAFVMALAIVSFAGTTAQPTAKNIKYLNEYGDYNDPFVEVVRVRYGRTGLSTEGLASGTVVSWDINSADGITVSALIGSATLKSPIAGVLVTYLATQDVTGAIGANDNYGYMAIRGYCLASIDTSEANVGGELIPSKTVIGAFGTRDLVQAAISGDGAGTLLRDPASDTMAPIVLK